MKRIMWPCLLCILAGCSSQADSGQPAKPSAQAETLRADPEKQKTEGGKPEDAVPRVTIVLVPEGGKPMVARTDAEGTIHLLYDSAAGPKYVMSRDNGKTLPHPYFGS